jgi:ABC-type siderophore export system fused ATPase/permease subunit
MMAALIRANRRRLFAAAALSLCAAGLNVVRKRLALVQSWLQAAEVYVLDEWAADQDPAARDHFYRQVLPRMQREGKTLVVVSHDDRCFALADRVVTFEQGRVRDVRESGHAREPESHGASRPPPAAPPVLSFFDLT